MRLLLYISHVVLTSFQPDNSINTPIEQEQESLDVLFQRLRKFNNEEITKIKDSIQQLDYENDLLDCNLFKYDTIMNLTTQIQNFASQIGIKKNEEMLELFKKYKKAYEVKVKGQQFECEQTINTVSDNQSNDTSYKLFEENKFRTAKYNKSKSCTTQRNEKDQTLVSWDMPKKLQENNESQFENGNLMKNNYIDYETWPGLVFNQTTLFNEIKEEHRLNDLLDSPPKKFKSDLPNYHEPLYSDVSLMRNQSENKLLAITHKINDNKNQNNQTKKNEVPTTTTIENLSTLNSFSFMDLFNSQDNAEKISQNTNNQILSYNYPSGYDESINCENNFYDKDLGLSTRFTYTEDLNHLDSLI